MPLVFSQGIAATVHALTHTALLEYVPFILLLLALFTVAGGIVSATLPGAGEVLSERLFALRRELFRCPPARTRQFL
jgi:hypothetical protein